MHEVLHDIATLSGHTDKVLAVDFAPGRSDRLLSAGKDGVVALWTLFGEESAAADLLRHTAPVSDAVYWPDDRGVLLASDDGTARLFDLDTGDETARFTTSEAMREGAAEASSFTRSIARTVNTAGQIVAAVIPLGVLITAATKSSEEPSGVVSFAADASLGRVAAMDGILELTVYDLVTGSRIRSWTLPGEPGTRLRFLADGTLAAACTSKLLIFDENQAKPARSLRVGRGGIKLACELASDRLAVIDNTRQLCVADLARRVSDVAMKLPYAPVAIAQCGPGAVVVADVKRRIARIMLDRPGQETWHDVPGGKIRAIDGSDDGSRVVVATDDQRVRVYEFRKDTSLQPRS